MSFTNPPSQYFDKWTIALFGKSSEFKKMIGNLMIHDNRAQFVPVGNGFSKGENTTFRVVIPPDCFDDKCQCRIVDFMALSHPGPSLFILAIDPENSYQDKVVDQISKLQKIFGDEMTQHLAVVTHNVKVFSSLRSLKEIYNLQLVTASEKLASDCEKWCSCHQPFLYDYNNYMKEVIKRRREELKNRRSDHYSSCCHKCTGVNPPRQFTLTNSFVAPSASGHDHGDSVDCDEFNIILLGKAGTGKSASANTILTVLNPQLDSRQLFKSRPSSALVTTRCDAKTVKKFGTVFTVVDTPDFFDEELENSQAHVEECRKYCQRGRCMVLLVIQLGRFTDGEVGILDKLEKQLGWRIRESTIVLLTHGEGFKDSVEMFVSDRTPLRHIVEACDGRHHIFKNTSRDPKQVMELMKKFPNYEAVFLKLTSEKGMCSLC